MTEDTSLATATDTADAAPARAGWRDWLVRVRTPGPWMYGAIALGVLLLATIVAVALSAGRPDFQPLYHGLAEADAGQIMEALNKMQVPVRVDRQTGTLNVPADRVAELRLKLAAQGLPRGTTGGFDTFEQQSGFGTSQFMENARYQHALEGELARSIMSIGAVANARVHLALPKDTVFVRNKQQPTASVLVQLQPGRAIDAGQVAAIVHLVSSSVPRLTPSQVSVVDQAGNLLTRPAGGTPGLNLDQMEYQQRLESNYTRRIEDLLTPILGANKMRAQVALDLDFSQLEETSESFDPKRERGMVRSEELIEENNNRPQPMGIPGALSNQPPGVATAPEQAAGAPAAQADPNNPNAPQPGGGQTGNGQIGPQGQAAAAAGAQQSDAQRAADGSRPMRTRSQSTRNYELDKRVSHITAAPGRVRRVSVAVVLDDRITVRPEGSVERVSWPQEDIDRITALVREAVGFDAQRGDTVNVMNATFATTPFDPNLLPFWRQDWFIELVKWSLVAIVAIVFLLVVVRPVVRRLLPPPPALPAPEPAAAAALAAPAATETGPGTALATTDAGGKALVPAEGGEASGDEAGAGGDEDADAVQLSAAGQALAQADGHHGNGNGKAPVPLPQPDDAEAIERLEERLDIARRLVAEDPRRAVSVLRTWMNRQPGEGMALLASQEEEEA
ncbi:MAG: flagellar M-ring protein FliF [Proteobacteria bacterium]|nr:flagellar M-ring protein FliF [Pseudomonadota bacterium]